MSLTELDRAICQRYLNTETDEQAVFENLFKDHYKIGVVRTVIVLEMSNSSHEFELEQSPRTKQERVEKEQEKSRQKEEAKEIDLGMYYPTAGSFHTSGIAVFIQQLIDTRTHSYTPYLYTESGNLTRKIQQSESEIIQINPNIYKKVGELMDEYLNVGNTIPFAILDEKLPLLIAAILSDTVHHLNENLDLLITHHYFDNIVLSNILNTPVVHMFHGVESVGAGIKAWKKFSKSDHVIVNSRHTQRIAEENLGCDITGIVHPGVDIEKFNPNVTSFASSVFDRDDTVILYAGRLTEAKGVYDLLEAFAALPAGFHLYIVGRGNQEKLKSEIQAYDIGDSVTIEDSVAHDVLPQYYKAADIVCSPTHYDSFCMVNVESMACGTPVVTTDIEGITEYAVDQETALLVPPQKPDDLANALLELASSPKLQQKLGEQGRAMAEHYSWEYSEKELAEIARKIID